MVSVLVVGATRGLGASLTKQYAAASPANTVYATTRASSAPSSSASCAPNTNIHWLTGIDLLQRNAADSIVSQLQSRSPATTTTTAAALDIVVITAGYFATEDFTAAKGPQWDDQVAMYTTSSVAPVFIVHRLFHAGLLHTAKVVLVSSESGSITLRHASEGGGNYAHHASKAALNMAGRLLSLDLQRHGVVVGIVHPGFMRTDMTKGVGFDKFWDDGGAVTPDEAATSLIEWTEKLDLTKTGEYWAPRGPGDIGTAEATLGKDLSTPLHLPW
ncbi:hypothetical protein BD289DRAFT_439549 [Coniella lustricola]|uniref:Oxidoreductase n=1 Tax=Coniella lustricola TaxID=2025994 RepID=A0A2T3A1F9_9PEZI|nr:hypothetical protein BD289DRAFT_439549 [Coniella lustricola]